MTTPKSPTTAPAATPVHAPPAAPPVAARPLPPLFVIVDHGAVPTPNLDVIARAIEIQINEHAGAFPPHGWGIAARVVVGKAGVALPPDAIEIGLFDHPDQAGALGYHGEDPRGRAFIHVFPLLDAQDGASVSGTISHEVLEAAVDPEGTSCEQSTTTGRVIAKEVCDPCEQQTYTITVADDHGVAHRVEVSDFVLPPYYGAPKDKTGVRYDYLGLIKREGEVLAGGYSQYLDANGWHEIKPTGPRRASFRLGHPTRGYRRRRHVLPAT